jgi:hypothetical protein
MDAPSQRENFNHPREIGFAFHGAGTNTWSISRINPPKFGGGLKFEPDADIGEKDSFRSGTHYGVNQLRLKTAESY